MSRWCSMAATPRERISRRCKPDHFVTSLTVTQHEDLLAVPAGRFHAFADPRLAGVTAYRSAKEIWGERRTVVVAGCTFRSTRSPRVSSQGSDHTIGQREGAPFRWTGNY